MPGHDSRRDGAIGGCAAGRSERLCGLDHDRIVAAAPIAGLPPLPREINPRAGRQFANFEHRDMKAEAAVRCRYVDDILPSVPAPMDGCRQRERHGKKGPGRNDGDWRMRPPEGVAQPVWPRPKIPRHRRQ